MHFKFDYRGREVQVNVSPCRPPSRRVGMYGRTLWPVFKRRDFYGIKRLQWAKDGACDDVVVNAWPLKFTALVKGYGQGQHAGRQQEA